MKTTDKHKADEVFARIKPPYSRSEEEVWQQMAMRMDAIEEVRHFRPVRMWSRIVAAASLALLLATTAVMRFHTTDLVTLPGITAQTIFPDGSQVHLKAGTSLSYHPWWWSVNPEVVLDGEAFFEGEHVDGFTVKAGDVRTTVLGTSFNVYARHQMVDVTCVTGMVRVESSADAVKLNAGDRVQWQPNSEPVISHLTQPQQAKSWIDAAYYYNAMSLSRVIEDVALRHNVIVNTTVSIDSLVYTGYLHDHHAVRDVLNLVGKPFGLTADSLGNDVYQLKDARKN